MSASPQNSSIAQDSSFSSEDVAESGTAGTMEEDEFKAILQNLDDIQLDRATTLRKSPSSETTRRQPLSGEMDPGKTLIRKPKKLVLIGRTGEGKSATGNQILQRKGFESTPSAGSVTAKCSKESREIDGRQLMIVDTPGLFDTFQQNDEIKHEILKFIAITSPGPHVFLLTIGVARYTQESEDTYAYVQELLGKKADKHTIIVFTRRDDLEDGETTIGEYLKNAPVGLKSLLRNVDCRYIALNNRLKLGSQESLAQVKELLTIVDELVHVNYGSVYSTPVYSFAESALKAKTKVKDNIVKNASVKRASTVVYNVKEKARTLESVKFDRNARPLMISRAEEELDSAIKEGKEEVKKIQEECEEKLEKNREELRTDIMANKVSVKESWFVSKLKKFKMLF